MKLVLSNGPLVVGTLSSLDGAIPLVGDLIEVRLDKAGQPEGWIERCKAIESAGKPVLLTVRLKSEGGEWTDDNEARLKLFEQGLAVVSAVDVELSSAICGQVAEKARAAGRICVASFHDFQKTPALAELQSVIARADELGAVPKIAAMIRQESDVEVLKSLLAKRGSQPLCVIAMGDQWKQTRVTFPKLGSCLTYGYIDKPTAPGQWSAAELIQQLRATKPV